MRKGRLAIGCMAIAIAFTFALVLSGLFGASVGQYTPRDNEYSTYEYSLSPDEDANYYYPLANYAVNRSGDSIGIFERVGVGEFDAEADDYQISSTGISYDDSFSYLAVHETVTRAVEFRAHEDNSLKFELDDDTGAIKSGDALLIGNEDASGVFVYKGDVTTSIDGKNVIFDVSAGSKVIFRVDPGRDKTVGSAVAGNRVAAEMYLADDNGYVVEDVLAIEDVEMYALTASDDEVEITISADSITGKAVVLHIDEPYLDYGSAEDITLLLDDEKVKEGEGMSETLWETGDDARYFAVKTDNGFDVVVYIPQYSDHILTIKSAERELGIDGMATLLAAIGIVGVAVLALMKQD